MCHLRGQAVRRGSDLGIGKDGGKHIEWYMILEGVKIRGSHIPPWETLLYHLGASGRATWNVLLYHLGASGRATWNVLLYHLGASGRTKCNVLLYHLGASGLTTWNVLLYHLGALLTWYNT